MTSSAAPWPRRRISDLPSTWCDGEFKDVVASINGIVWNLPEDKDRASQELGRVLVHREHLVKPLLDRGVNPNAPWYVKGRKISPLMFALRNNSAEVVRALLHHGARPLNDEHTLSPALMTLMWTGTGHTVDQKNTRNARVLDLLRAHRLLLERDMPPHSNRAMLFVITSNLPGLTALIPDMLRHRLGSVDQPWEGQSPLGQALAMASPERVDVLLRHGARPTAQDPWPWSVVVKHPMRKETVARWLYRTLSVVDVLATFGVHDPGTLPSVESHAAIFFSDPLEHTAVEAPPHARLWLSMARANVTPNAWWAALKALDEPSVMRMLAVSQNACATWLDAFKASPLAHLVVHSLTGDPRDPGFSERIAVAARLAQTLVQQGADPWHRAAPLLNSALGQALTLNDPRMARAMVNGCTPDQRNDLVGQALRDQKLDVEQLQRLLSFGVPLEHRSRNEIGVDQGTPLWHVIDPLQEALVVPLLAAGADPHARVPRNNATVPRDASDVAEPTILEWVRTAHTENVLEKNHRLGPVLVHLERVVLQRTLQNVDPWSSQGQGQDQGQDLGPGSSTSALDSRPLNDSKVLGVSPKGKPRPRL